HETGIAAACPAAHVETPPDASLEARRSRLAVPVAGHRRAAWSGVLVCEHAVVCESRPCRADRCADYGDRWPCGTGALQLASVATGCRGGRAYHPWSGGA